MGADQEMGSLFERGFLRKFAPGEVIFVKGAAKGTVLRIIEGWVLATDPHSDGTETPLELRGPGQLVGETSALCDGPRNATVSAVCRTTAFAVGSGEFLAHVGRDRELIAALLLDEASRHHAANLRAGIRPYGIVPALSRLLLDLARRSGSTTLQGIPQRVLAGLLGVTRPTLRVGLRSLAESGAVIARRPVITITDEQTLRETARLEG
jgi:CRP-like cAMP-binding protein